MMSLNNSSSSIPTQHINIIAIQLTTQCFSVQPQLKVILEILLSSFTESNAEIYKRRGLFQ